MTGPECRSGTDRVYEAIKTIDADVIINLQGDEPEIRGDMIDALIRAVEQERLGHGHALLDHRRSPGLQKSPRGQMRARQEQFRPLLLKGASPLPAEAYLHPLYKHIGIYGFSRSFLETFVSLPRGELEEAESLEQLRALEAGYRIKVIVDGV